MENKIFSAAKPDDLRTSRIVPMVEEERFTLAGILLLGKDKIIAAAAPSFRINLIKRT
jgi:predicted HTH transcriptional regulator